MDTTHQPAGSDSDNDLVVVDHDQVSDYNPEQMLPRPPQVIQSIRSWLQPTSYDLPSGEYRKHLASHMAGTGSWLTSDQSYRGWLEQPDRGLLWIQGCPGSGKSVMAAKLVHELTREHPDCPVLFFFFRQIIDANHEPQALLRDWMDQVLSYSPPLQARLESYVDSGRSVETLSMDDMWRDLRTALAGLPKRAFCVADALDEMDLGNDAFLTALGSLGRWRPDKVKVLMTSRLVPSLQVPLRGLPCIHMRLEEPHVDGDISTFVRRSLDMSSIAKPLWDRIMNAVPGRANGIFLYAKLAMDAFLEPGADINVVLSQLPADLNVLYTRLLREHAVRSGVSRDIQDLLLQSVTHASRPLRLLELAEMIKVHQPEDGTRDLKTTKHLIRIACGPLLEILPDETVSVIHHSFTEYLKGTTRPGADDTHYPVLKAGPTHARLAMACLQYLLSGCLRTVKVDIKDDAESLSQWQHFRRNEDRENEQKATLTIKHPFAKYAIDNWHHHIRQSEAAGYDQQQVSALVDNLLGDAPSRKAWLQLTWPGGHLGAGRVTQLHIAGQTGLLAYMRGLLATTEVDQEDAHGKTALWWAASEGHADAVGVLLAAGANPDKDESIYGLKPLHQAARANHAAVVTRLLQAGVDALTPKTKCDPGRTCGNAPISKGHSPLMFACQSGHVEAVSAFLPFLSKENAQLALYWAAETAQAQAVARIIQQPGVDVNGDVRGVTPLSLACSCGDLDSVKALIRAGADPSIRNLDLGSECAGRDRQRHHRPNAPRSETCLHALAGLGPRSRSGRDCSPEIIQEIFSLIADEGVDINLRNLAGETALHGATRSPVLTRLLLNAGADANATDRAGSTPLHRAKSADVISILIEEGQADINLAQDDGRTPLLRMLAHYDYESVLTLLEYGPDCNATDNEGNGAFHSLMGSSLISCEVVNALCKRRADPNLHNKQGLTPLLSMRSHMLIQDEALDAFIGAGADLNAVDRQGKTWLFYKINQAYNSKVEEVVKTIQSLTGRGAIVTCRDNRGRTLLHETMSVAKLNLLSSSNLLEALADLGMDLKAVDYAGNTLLHELALRNDNHSHYSGHEYVPVYRKLLEMGLDLEQKNYRGQTALHVLCSAKVDEDYPLWPLAKTMAIDYVMSMMRTVNVVDNDGVTPLHIACTLGQLYSKKLLDAGADATAQTYEGLSALHLAARCRLSNVVGMLLAHLETRSEQVVADANNVSQGTAWLTKHVNATATESSYREYTPLHFAARSGTPETVALLLKAGADAKMPGLLDACKKFAEEDKYWTSDQTPYIHALKIDDTCRRLPGQKYNRCRSQIPLSAEARMEEVVDMLLKRGVRLDRQGYAYYGTLRYCGYQNGPWDNGQFDYVTTCIEQWMKKYGLEEEGNGEGNEVFRLSFSQMMHKNMEETEYRTIRQLAEGDAPMLKKGSHNVHVFASLLMERKYRSVQLLQEVGTDFLIRSKEYGMSNLALLAQHGFASLVDKMGTVEAGARFASGEWHAYGEASRPGLWRVTSKGRKGQDDHQGKGSNEDDADDDIPLLLRAVQRVQPNMDVVNVLVEKLGVHLDQVTTIGTYASQKEDTSALLYAAGGYSWWHAHQVVPYLIRAGADMEIINHKGQTPLQVALSAGKAGGIFSMEACRALVHAGANVNAVDAEGMTCLAHAGHNMDLMHLLLDNGAQVTSKALLAAIDAEKVEVVQALLSRGADANMRPNKTEDEGKPKKIPGFPDDFNAYIWEQGNAIEPSELYALYHAAHTLETGAGGEIVRLLLQHGADPMAKYLQRVSWKDQDDEEEQDGNVSHVDDKNDDDVLVAAHATPTIVVPRCYREQTILHSLLYDNKPIDEFLGLPQLDVNHRDANGRTVLLAACVSSDGLDHLVRCTDANGDDGNRVDGRGGHDTVLQRLIALGADIEACDNAGRNVVHVLATRSYNNDKKYAESLKYILRHAPHLIHQADIGGYTPLHLAILSSLSEGATLLATTLLDSGADASAMTNCGDTALHLLASALRREEIMSLFKLLVECHGLNVNARNNRGETPVFGWCKVKAGNTSHNTSYWYHRTEKDELEIVSAFLTKLGVDFAARDGRGRSLLHLSAGGTAKRFQCLMDLGADATAEDDGHQTAIDVAAAKGNKDVLQLFEKK